MGLDMYLEARKYIQQVDWKSLEKDRVYEEYPVTPEYALLRGFFPEGADEYSNVSGGEVKLTVGYWRKANHIHDWFVRNVQNHEDDCGSYYVSHDQLESLAEVCRAVVAQPAMSSTYLPTTSGVFFGSTEYDEYYIESIGQTLKIVEKALSLPEATYDIYYHASW